ncbi:DMT family transporter [Jeongeupia naejangsanensis]|uniref:DMT family transporter n=1 Tax=Jeongeupia naejangsanensis TaxID=613195 RepID=A0ABS2BJE9_9NEIS|nr:DMT family transporter [Jeongeupia naejangsanensis]MBM3115737.1 DMT family transporter [Jeongeupia naejangsanensis]
MPPSPSSPSGTATFGLSPQQLGLVLAFLSATGFATKAVFVKLAYRHGVDAVTLLTLRLGFALALIGAWRLVRQARGVAAPATPVSRSDLGLLLLLGLLGYYLASLFDFIGLVTVSASIERLVLYLYPTLTVLLSALFFRTPVTRRMIGALLLTYAGIAVVIGPGLAGAHADLAGLAWIVASTVAFALYLTFSPGVIKRIGSMRFTEAALTVSGAAMLIQYVLTRPLPLLFSQPWPVYGYALITALVATVLPIWMMAAAMARIGAGRAAIAGSIGPVITIILSLGILDESLSPLQWLGVAVVMAGVSLIGKR